jgi:hypothetical protein
MKALILILLSFSFVAQAKPMKKKVDIVVTGLVKYTGDSASDMCKQAEKKATALAFNICDRFPSRVRPAGTFKKCDISKNGDARRDLSFRCTKISKSKTATFHR